MPRYLFTYATYSLVKVTLVFFRGVVQDKHVLAEIKSAIGGGNRKANDATPSGEAGKTSKQRVFYNSPFQFYQEVIRGDSA